jgi:dTDP-4-dehydrorhamnose 3,5-epimerase
MSDYKKLEFSDQQAGVIYQDLKRFGDDRGDFININFDVNLKRSYLITNNQVGVVRAFHGHRQEAKLFYVPQGSFKFIIMDMEANTWKEYVLQASVPRTLYIPSGYYNGFVSLSDDALLVVYSSSTMEESRNDDIRLPYDCLGTDVWKINNR